MEKDKEFLWEEQLEKFKEVFCFDGVDEELNRFIQDKNYGRLESANNFQPSSAESLYTYDSNLQYHLNGRNLFGLKRKWFVEYDEWSFDDIEDKEMQEGLGLNSGLIQLDKSGLLNNRLNGIFVPAKDETELIEKAGELLDLSNEEIIRRFDIKVPFRRDLAILFSSVVADEIIKYEIEHNNFGGYGTCWADLYAVGIKTKNEGKEHSVYSHSSSLSRSRVVELQNGESIEFEDVIVDDKESEYRIR